MLGNAEKWKSLLEAVSPAARVAMEKAFGSKLPPLFEWLRDTVSRPCPAAAALLHNGLVVSAISNPGVLSLNQAIELAQAASRIETGLDYKILSKVTGADRDWPRDIPRQQMMRVLQVIDATSDCQRLILPLMKFARLGQPHLRSKAVKLLARASRNPGWANAILGDPDPRVRSNLIEGLAGHLGNRAAAMLQSAARDPHHRVSVTALLQLARLGDSPSQERLQAMSAAGDDLHKRAAAWALRKLEESARAAHAGSAIIPSTAAPHPTA